ncbi:MAG: CDP-diacylglycerol--glycerol-3-phosphate 3-phosphatidyltransferase, partial [Candidatus Saccharibacteria bacterium]|nr:CDP-diacylglycerol--glycerol-3-phosphate 3-phosphatidyltransferase [Candidatus Saccharibacteria bacterium]
MTGPTYLTILRMLLSVVFLVFATLPDTWARITALVIFIIASITDKIDGHWARKSKQVTDLGAFLDPLADKMLINLAFLALVYLGVVPLWVFAIILVRDFAVDGMRMMAARNKITIAASFFGKLKTTVQMITLIILLLNLIINNDIIGILA